MNFVDLLGGFALGITLGGAYFYCLWLTVKRLFDHKHPIRLMALSFIFRAGVAVTCFVLITIDGHYTRLLWAIVGFLSAREFLKRRLGGLQFSELSP
ncbi:MAG: ATP synthase subunit I [Syntrophales bacterium]|nr:ATP synthase subunit I [Syntrophales bacterium]